MLFCMEPSGKINRRNLGIYSNFPKNSKKKFNPISSYGLLLFRNIKVELVENDVDFNIKDVKNTENGQSVNMLVGEQFWSNFNEKCSVNSSKSCSVKNITTINDDDILFLLQQRRDTFEYVDFLFGSWSPFERTIDEIFTLMTEEERDRIKDYTFEELWDDIWIDRTAKQYTENKAKAKSRYESIQYQIPVILSRTKSIVKELPWGFPKGRKKDLQETDLMCAVRETEEETRIPRENYNILLPSETFKLPEQFKGSNNLFYNTIYFFAEVNGNYDILQPINTPQCIRQTCYSLESTAVKWVTYQEACKCLNNRRQLLLKEALEKIKKYYRNNG